MRIIFILLSCFTCLCGEDFYDFFKPSIEVLPYHPSLICNDIYIRPVVDIESEYPRYLFQFHEFPKDVEITVLIQRIAQKTPDEWKPIYKFSIKPSGMIVDNGNPMGYMLCLSSQGCLPGERITFSFETEAGFKQTVSFIPNPLNLKNRKGSVLIKTELLGLNPTYFRLEFPGLKYKENVKLSYECQGVCREPFKHKASDVYIFSPEVEGLQGGSTLFTVARPTQKFKMFLPWGTEIMKNYGAPYFFRP